MLKKYTDRSNKAPGIIIICAIVIAAIGIGLWLWCKPKTELDDKNFLEKVCLLIKHQRVMDYNKLGKDNQLKDLIQKRKAEYGVDKGIDIIVNSDEALKIGDITVSMQEILDTIRLESGDVVERDIKPDRIDPKRGVNIYGIYVVQPGDNMWNIHFRFLKDYFHHKGIALSPLADKSDRPGFSSGAGKIPKFFENMVHIYDIKDRKLDTELNRILPLSKIVVYNMQRIFALLDQIDYNHVNHIRFDGETFWIPAEP